MDLFIKNWNNCAVITLYQFIQLSHMTYKEFKQMAKDLTSNFEYDMRCISFVEPIVKKYWDEKDVYKFPDFNKPVPFEGNNKLGKCRTCIPWDVKKDFEGVDTEYMAIDYFGRLLLRITTLIDIDSDEYHMQLKDYWKLSKPELLGKALANDHSPMPPELCFAIDSAKAERLNAYITYMSKFTDTVPLIGYEVVFYEDDKKYDFHIFTYIRESKGQYIELNSNLSPRKVDQYNAVVVRKTSGIWKKEPPMRVIDTIEDYEDMPQLIDVLVNPTIATEYYEKT